MDKLCFLISPKPVTLDKDHFDYLQQTIKSNFDESKIELSTDMEYFKPTNTYTFINDYYVNVFLSKVCDWCKKSIQTKDLHNYYTFICKSEDGISQNIENTFIIATRKDNTIRQDMCFNCYDKFNQFINDGTINNLSDIGIIEKLPYDDECIYNCDKCNKQFHIFNECYYDKEKDKKYCEDCDDNNPHLKLINDDYNFGSIYDWIVIGTFKNNIILLCNLNPSSKYYKCIGYVVCNKDDYSYYNLLDDNILNFENLFI